MCIHVYWPLMSCCIPRETRCNWPLNDLLYTCANELLHFHELLYCPLRSCYIYTCILALNEFLYPTGNEVPLNELLDKCLNELLYMNELLYLRRFRGARGAVVP